MIILALGVVGYKTCVQGGVAGGFEVGPEGGGSIYIYTYLYLRLVYTYLYIYIKTLGPKLKHETQGKKD